MVFQGNKSRWLVVSTVAALAAGSGAAWADPGDPGQPPPAPPGAVAPPPVGVAPVALYPAPLSQTTQTTYVPQSVAMSGPEEITNDVDGRPAPAGYTAVQRKRKGLLIAGPVLLGSVYLYTAFAAAIGTDLDNSSGNSTSNIAPLFVPVAGPFIEMGETSSATLKYLLAMDGAAQVAGAIMLYYGLTSTKTVFVRNDLLYGMTVTPMVGVNNTTGLALSGRF
jgi:hypothetical protein